jgi:hypothetical protein
MMAAAVSRGRPAKRWFPQRLGDFQAAKKTRFMLHDRTMIRHASHSGTITATSLGVHGATARGCLIASASFPSPVAPSFLGTGSHAVNLTSVAPPTDKNLTTATSTKKNPARHFINTYVRACQTRAILVLCVGKFQQYWALRELVSILDRSDIAATGFRSQPIGSSPDFGSAGR